MNSKETYLQKLRKWMESPSRPTDKDEKVANTLDELDALWEVLTNEEKNDLKGLKVWRPDRTNG